MKILILNSKLDVTAYYRKHGVDIQIDYATLPGIFPVGLVASKLNQFGVMTDFYSPDVMEAVRAIVKPLQYHTVIFCFKPSDYDNRLASTGGYTYGQDVYLGTQLATVRLDGYEQLYAEHELMHCICHKLERMMLPIFDQMDSTLVNGAYQPYYENTSPDAPDGNFAMTWKSIVPFISHVDEMPPLLCQSNNFNPWAFALQLQLLSFGYTGIIADGFFGSKTLAVVRSLQSASGLTVDGKVGVNTLSALKKKA